MRLIHTSYIMAILLVCLPGQAETEITIDLGRGPVTVAIPNNFNPNEPMPLLVMLHGYSGSGMGQEAYLKFRPLVDGYGFIHTNPDGTVNPVGNRFWNAGDTCCNFYGSDVDDVVYLTELVEAISAQYPVDPQRIYFMGHSNGGFMSFRMACDRADMVAGFQVPAPLQNLGSCWDPSSLVSRAVSALS